MARSLETWFKTEILIHEEILMRYLARVWPCRDEHAELRQEVYARVYETALQARPHTPKALLFSIARHVMVDRRRRERIVSIQAAGNNDFSNDLLEEKTPERGVGERQEFARLARAFDRLPARCREVVWMRRVQGLPQRDVAQRLGISAKTVEQHVSKGSRLLAEYMQQSDSAGTSSQPNMSELDDEISEEAKDEDQR